MLNVLVFDTRSDNENRKNMLDGNTSFGMFLSKVKDTVQACYSCLSPFSCFRKFLEVEELVRMIFELLSLCIKEDDVRVLNISDKSILPRDMAASKNAKFFILKHNRTDTKEASIRRVWQFGNSIIFSSPQLSVA